MNLLFKTELVAQGVHPTVVVTNPFSTQFVSQRRCVSSLVPPRKYTSPYSVPGGFENVDGPTVLNGTVGGREPGQARADHHAVFSAHRISPCHWHVRIRLENHDPDSPALRMSRSMTPDFHLELENLTVRDILSRAVI
jgi:hypothetical protein